MILLFVICYLLKALEGGTRFFVACSNVYAISISSGSLHCAPTNPTPNGAGLALNPAGKGCCGALAPRKRHRDDRVPGASGDAGAGSTGRDERVELMCFQHAIDPLIAAQAVVFRVIRVEPRLVGGQIDFL